MLQTQAVPAKQRTEIPIARIAMWSGPRNLSTAMMRAWENRPDTFVHDEPFYAHYLTYTNLNHPGAAEIKAHHQTDWHQVVNRITAGTPHAQPIYYQKHMAHHLLPHFDWGWLVKLQNAFLIRKPKDMLLSLSQKLDHIRLKDTGLSQQVAIFDYLRNHSSQNPPVIDAEDMQNHPKETLTALCNALGVPFSQRMLSWPQGPRSSDGIWAKHWYAEVEASSGFEAYQYPNRDLPEKLKTVHERCLVYYETLAAHRIKISP